MDMLNIFLIYPLRARLTPIFHRQNNSGCGKNHVNPIPYSGCSLKGFRTTIRQLQLSVCWCIWRIETCSTEVAEVVPYLADLKHSISLSIAGLPCSFSGISATTLQAN
jgi:hypothetical protein